MVQNEEKMERREYTREFVFDKGDMFFRIPEIEKGKFSWNGDVYHFLGEITDVTVTKKMLPLYCFSDQNYQTNMDKMANISQFSPKPYEEVKKVIDEKLMTGESYIIINYRKGDVFVRDFIAEKLLELQKIEKNKDNNFLGTNIHTFFSDRNILAEGKLEVLLDSMFYCGCFDSIDGIGDMKMSKFKEFIDGLAYYLNTYILTEGGMDYEEMKLKGVGNGRDFVTQKSCVVNKKKLNGFVSNLWIDYQKLTIESDGSGTSVMKHEFDDKIIFEAFILALKFLFGTVGKKSDSEERLINGELYDKAYLIADLIADFLERRNDFDNLVNDVYDDLLAGKEETLFEIISMI